MLDDTTELKYRLRLIIPPWLDEVTPQAVDLSYRDAVSIQRPSDGRRFVLGRQTFNLLVDLSCRPTTSFDAVLVARQLPTNAATYELLYDQVRRLSDVTPRLDAPGFVARWNVIPAPMAAAVGGFFIALFKWPVAVVGLALLLCADVVVVLGLSLYQLTLTAAPVGLVVLLASAIVHEFGHAGAIVKAGRAPGAIGFGIYLVWPVLYADTSEAWFLRRRERMLVDVGGVYFQLLFCLVVGVAGIVSGSHELQLASLLSQSATVVNFNPLFRYDGHWLLSDWLGVANLYRAGRQSWKANVPAAAGRRDHLVLRTFWAVAVVFWPLVLIGALTSFVVQVIGLVRNWTQPGFDLLTTNLVAPSVTAVVLVISAVNAIRLLAARRRSGSPPDQDPAAALSALRRPEDFRARP